MQSLHQITHEVNTPAADIRAEVILAQLLKNGLMPADIIVRLQGQHRRPVCTDLDGARVEQASGSKEQLALHLNRDGIYDTLPEGIFHQPSGSNKAQSPAEMIASWRIYKQEEQEARLFFAPLEQEFFLQKVFTEQQLQEAIVHIQHALPDDAVLELLGIDPGLPLFFKATLLRLLSYIPVIAGDLALLSKVFTLLLGVPANISRQLRARSLKHDPGCGSGGVTLGSNMVLGKQSIEIVHQYQLVVGPVSADKLLYFFPGNMGGKCIETLIRFFIPVIWELEVKITGSSGSKDGFALDRQNHCTARLGYNIVLGKANETING